MWSHCSVTCRWSRESAPLTSRIVLSASCAEDTARFFAPEYHWRGSPVHCRKYCVDLLYCPDTWPVDAATLEAFRNHAWLRPIAQAGIGIVYQVIP